MEVIHVFWTCRNGKSGEFTHPTLFTGVAVVHVFDDTTTAIDASYDSLRIRTERSNILDDSDGSGRTDEDYAIVECINSGRSEGKDDRENTLD